MKRKFHFRRTTLLSAGLTAFLLGLVVSRWQGIWLSADWLMLALPFLFLLRRKTVVSLMAAVIIGYILGLWRGGAVLAQVSQYAQFYDRKVTLAGNVRNDPIYDDRGQLDFRVTKVSVDGTKLPGEVRVRGFVNDIRRGDTVRVDGQMRSGFASYQAEVSFAEVTVTQRSGSWLERTRREFFASTYSVLPEPQASLGLGFLVGLRSALPEDFDDQLRIAGLTHIVVASGYNLTILVRMSRRLMARRSKYQAFISSVALIMAFIVITGASPAIVRAAVVTLLSLAAWYYGRRIQPVLIILLGAALTAGVSPLYIWYDLGWWLSFLAFTGVLLIAPLITRRVFKDRKVPLMAQVALETTAAQLMAVPLIMYVFGDLSLVALLANMAVVPLIPFAMIATFIGGLAGLVSPIIGSWLALPAQLILSYIVSVTQLLAQPSWAKHEIALSGLGMVLLYAAVLLVGLGLYRRTRLRFSQVPAIVE